MQGNMIRKGYRFFHARVLDASRLPEKVPALYEVTRVAMGSVYYRPVHRQIDDSGKVLKEEFGKSECCQMETFSRIGQNKA